MFSWPIRRRFSHSPFLYTLIGIVIGSSATWFVARQPWTEKAIFAPPKKTAYTALSNEELKNRSAQLAAAIHGLARSFYEEDNRLRIAADEKLAGTKSPGETDYEKRGSTRAPSFTILLCSATKIIFGRMRCYCGKRF